MICRRKGAFTGLDSSRLIISFISSSVFNGVKLLYSWNSRYYWNDSAYRFCGLTFVFFFRHNQPHLFIK
jgi:hypothetical protein